MLDRATEVALPGHWQPSSAPAPRSSCFVTRVLTRRIRRRRRDPLIESRHTQVIELLSADTDEEADEISRELLALRAGGGMSSWTTPSA